VQRGRAAVESLYLSAEGIGVRVSRVYATDERGKRFLRYIECDRCDRTAEPGSEELLEEWRKEGTIWPGGDVVRVDLCPDHARAA
jgi:hypothetical protein